MEHTLPEVSLVVALLGWIISLWIESRPIPPAGSKRAGFSGKETSFWIFAWLVAIVVLALTLPGTRPFAPGTHFGPGYFLGAVLFLIPAGIRTRGRTGPALSLIWAGVLAAGAAPLLSPHYGQIDALLGATTGMAVTALILSIAVEEESACAHALSRSTLFGVAAGLAAALGLLRTALITAPTPQAPVLWQNCAVAVAAIAALAISIGVAIAPFCKGVSHISRFLAARLYDEEDAGAAIGLVFAGLVGFAGVSVLSLNWLQEPGMAQLFAFGILAGLVVLLLGRQADPSTGLVAPLSATVLLVAFMAAFGALQGFGAAILLLGAALPLIFLPERNSRAVLQVGLMGLGLLVYRVFVSHYAGVLRGASLSDNLALFGIMAGALLPQIPALLAREGARTSLVRLIVAAFCGLLAPVAVICFYGAMAGPSLLVGLALSCLVRRSSFAALWALVMALALTEVTTHLLPIADLTRLDRLQLLIVSACAAAAVLVLFDAINRRKAAQVLP